MTRVIDIIFFVAFHIMNLVKVSFPDLVLKSDPISLFPPFYWFTISVSSDCRDPSRVARPPGVPHVLHIASFIESRLSFSRLFLLPMPFRR